jgi:hypothetical protein
MTMERWEDYLKENPTIEIINDECVFTIGQKLESSKNGDCDKNHSFQNKKHTLETIGPFIDKNNNIFYTPCIIHNSYEKNYGIIQPVKRVIKIFKK